MEEKTMYSDSMQPTVTLYSLGGPQKQSDVAARKK